MRLLDDEMVGAIVSQLRKHPYGEVEVLIQKIKGLPEIEQEKPKAKK
jgi:hypothetical protein